MVHERLHFWLLLLLLFFFFLCQAWLVVYEKVKRGEGERTTDRLIHFLMQLFAFFAPLFRLVVEIARGERRKDRDDRDDRRYDIGGGDDVTLALQDISSG